MLNIEGYFDELLVFLEKVAAEGLVKPAHRDVPVVERCPETLIEKLQARQLLYIDKLR